MTTIMGTDPTVALAALTLELDERRVAVDEQELRSARAEQQRELVRQISALHAAADHLRTGALLEGACSLGGAALATAGIARAGDPSRSKLSAVGTGLEHLAGPLGRLLGEAPRLDAEADAKQAEAKRADASARAEEAVHHRDRVEQELERTLSTADGALQAEAQGNLALLANV